MSPSTGGLAIAVPAQIAGFWAAWKKYGRVPWRQLIQPTIDLARDGFVVDKALHNAIRGRTAIDGTGGYDVRQEPSLRLVKILAGK